MVTPYCSKDQWAVRMRYDNWDAFIAAENWPTADLLQETLEDATNIMNDTEHINTSSNITTIRHLGRLERICFNMTNRMLDIDQTRGQQGGSFGIQPWSQADFLMTFERSFLKTISKTENKRKVGKWVF